MTTRLANVFIMMAMLVVAAAALPAKAVVLTFDSSDGIVAGSVGDASLATYGDNVAGSPQDGFTYYNLGEGWAPDVSLSFHSVAGDYHTYSDPVWTGVLTGDFRYVTFTPANGASVVINDLNLEGYGLASITSLKVVTFDGDGFEDVTLLTVVGTTTSVVSGPVGQLFSVNYTGAPGQTIGLMAFGGSGNTVALNSLRFSEVVAPEPASLGLLVLGALPLLRRKRR